MNSSWSSHEHQELVSLSDAIESAGVRRLQYAADLTRLRGVGFRQLMAQLNIPDMIPSSGGQTIGWREAS